jgi:hypothetical protein
VAAVVIVGVQPSCELFAAFGVAVVEAGVGPLVGQGAVESLHLALGLGPVGAGLAVFNLAESLSEDVGSVTGSIVCVKPDPA